MIHLSLKKGKRMTTLTEIQTNGAKWKRALESVRKEAQFAADHGPPDARILAHRILSLFENSATEGRVRREVTDERGVFLRTEYEDSATECRCFPNTDGTGQNNVRCPVHRDSATEDRARTYLREQMLRALPDATEEQVDELLWLDRSIIQISIQVKTAYQIIIMEKFSSMNG